MRLRVLFSISLALMIASACTGDDDEAPTPAVTGTPAASASPEPCPTSESPGYELTVPPAEGAIRTPVEFTVSIGDTVPAFVRLVNRADPKLIYGFFEIDPGTPLNSEVSGGISFSVVGRRDACLIVYSLGEPALGTPAKEMSVPVVIDHQAEGAVCESSYSAPGPFVVRSPAPFDEVPADIPVEIAAQVDGQGVFDVLITNTDGAKIGEGQITPGGDVALGEASADEVGGACISIVYTPPVGEATTVARIPVFIVD